MQWLILKKADAHEQKNLQLTDKILNIQFSITFLLGAKSGVYKSRMDCCHVFFLSVVLYTKKNVNFEYLESEKKYEAFSTEADLSFWPN